MRPFHYSIQFGLRNRFLSSNTTNRYAAFSVGVPAEQSRCSRVVFQQVEQVPVPRVGTPPRSLRSSASGAADVQCCREKQPVSDMRSQPNCSLISRYHVISPH